MTDLLEWHKCMTQLGKLITLVPKRLQLSPFHQIQTALPLCILPELIKTLADEEDCELLLLYPFLFCPP